MLDLNDTERLIKLLIRDSQNIEDLNIKYQIMLSYMEEARLLRTDDLNKVKSIGKILPEVCSIKEKTNIDMIHEILSEPEVRNVEDEWSDDIMVRDRMRERLNGWD